MSSSSSSSTTSPEATPSWDSKYFTSARPRNNAQVEIKPHRCNAHLEDFLNTAHLFPPRGLAQFRTWIRCVRSKPGEEPPRYGETEE